MLVNKWIYSFHMPLFFFVSGFLQRKSEERKLMTKSIFLKKILGMIIPYIIFSFIYWAFKIVFSQKVNNPFTVKDILLIWIFPLSDLWFLYALLCFFIIHVLMVKIKIDSKVLALIALMVSLLSSLIPWNNVMAATAFPRMCLNITYYSSGIMLPTLLGKKEKLSKTVIGILLVGVGGVICFINEGNALIDSFLRVASAYCTILGLYMVSQKIAIKSIQFLGSKSLYVYLVHDYAVCAAVIMLRQHIASNFFLTGIAILSGLLFSLVVIRVCTKIKMLDALFRPSILMKT